MSPKKLVPATSRTGRAPALSRYRDELLQRIEQTLPDMAEEARQIARYYVGCGVYDKDILKGDETYFAKLVEFLGLLQSGHPGVELFNADFRQVELTEGSVDVIITDPPYPKKYLDCYRELAVLAARVLRPGGSLLTMAGQSYLPEVISLLSSEYKLQYHWTICYLTPGGQSPQIWPRKVNTFWKPVLWYTKGKYDRHWVGDVAKSNVNNNDKRFHHWGQSESGLKDLVERFSRPGEVILDPFMGGGTTGVVAKLLHRRFIGVEIDETAYVRAKSRILDANLTMPGERSGQLNLEFSLPGGA